MLDDFPECTRCAACCYSKSERYVPVTGVDYARLGDAADQLVVFWGNKAFMKMKDGHCAALRIDGHAFFCTVYDRRPEICRELERGSGQCEAAIDML